MVLWLPVLCERSSERGGEARTDPEGDGRNVGWKMPEDAEYSGENVVEHHARARAWVWVWVWRWQTQWGQALK